MKAKLKHNKFDYIIYDGENVGEVISFIETDKEHNKTYNIKIIHKDFSSPDSYVEITTKFTTEYMNKEAGELHIVPNEYVIKINDNLATFITKLKYGIDFIVLTKEEFDSLFDKELTT